MADTHIWRTGALGETTNLASEGSSNTTSSTPSCNSTSKPSRSAIGRSVRRASSSASSLRTRNSCSESVAMSVCSNQPVLCGLAPGRGRRLVGRGEIAAASPDRQARLLHSDRQLVNLAIEDGRLERQGVLTVQLLRDLGECRGELRVLFQFEVAAAGFVGDLLETTVRPGPHAAL